MSWRHFFFFFFDASKITINYYRIPFHFDWISLREYTAISLLLPLIRFSWHLMWHKGRRTWPRSIATEPKLYCTARSISPVNCLDTRKFRRWTRVDRCPLSNHPNRSWSFAIDQCHDEEWKRRRPRNNVLSVSFEKMYVLFICRRGSWEGQASGEKKAGGKKRRGRRSGIERGITTGGCWHTTSLASATPSNASKASFLRKLLR